MISMLIAQMLTGVSSDDDRVVGFSVAEQRQQLNI